MLNSIPSCKINLMAAAALCGFMAPASPAFADVTVCNAQGRCATVDTCQVTNDGAACATSNNGSVSACHQGGSCYGNVKEVPSDALILKGAEALRFMKKGVSSTTRSVTKPANINTKITK
ncbi:hypothetical protein EOK75_12265 [Pseudorhodobacter turbinis]|uniref:Uncharacterized protein n=1 Tax=Pseudorhodobacter turbinis TaxID=2500533 RepID=A0A4V1E103_9RHOB|nr:hypothetical protein [Pseudorhodobacter turbinis]QCO56434.1 hypothetical protein EOK75_12265 [Pseudorhodobacter turbinis]